MVRQMTATQLKTQLLRVLDDVGAGSEVEITRHGRTVARLVPAGGRHDLRGRLAGVVVSVADEEDLFATGAPWATG
ncbi:MAG: type II toxin-antitoxin system Phd/YefM family antitoxin [Ilumatobacteraceae bacterium]